MKPPIMTCADFQGAHCGSPGCTEAHGLTFNSKCHPRQGVDVTWEGGGVIEVACHVCAQHIATIAVALNLDSHPAAN